jgi:hypothetical protein
MPPHDARHNAIHNAVLTGASIELSCSTRTSVKKEKRKKIIAYDFVVTDFLETTATPREVLSL